MTSLSEVLDIGMLHNAIADGYVRLQVHPELPLAIYNYTERAQYENVWNSVTLTCRGLIVDSAGEVVARPFRKFFNYGQTGAPTLDLSAPAVVTDKLDGSLGIVYPTPDGPAVATRGSFTSDQALHATELLRTRYANWRLLRGWTALFEIIYPENRVVLDYGYLDELVLLGAVEIATGESLSPQGAASSLSWRGLCAEVLHYDTLAAALAAPPRPGKEGLVVHLWDADERVKIKQEDYVTLHKIVTGLTARTVWEHLLVDRPLAELLEPLPDEFHLWAAEVAAHIELAVLKRELELRETFSSVLGEMPVGWQSTTREGRRAFADVALRHADSWALFALLDGKNIRSELLKRARPEAFLTVMGRIHGEDEA